MKYSIEIKATAIKDLKRLGKNTAVRITKRIMAMSDDLQGDIKKLQDNEPNYRMRVGDFRVLFDLEGNNVIVYRVMHRKESYI